MDPQQHALMHALLLGTWTGTLTSSDGSATPLDLAATNDKHGELTLRLASAQSKAVGAASDVTLDGHRLRWTQALSGMSCKVSAVMTGATEQTAGMMKGTMACADSELAFALQKKK
jgi:hypothetical protein